jgi:hypothetical protein
MTGIIVYYLPAKGYGYVRVPGTRNSISEPITCGSRYRRATTYNFNSRKGPRAIMPTR